MGVKTQLSMISALVLVSLLLLRWTPADDYDTGRAFVTSVRGLSEASAGKAAAAAGAACKPGATPRPPVSVEWVGREAMIVSYSDKISVEVYKHDFPGSTLCEWGGGEARGRERESIAITPFLYLRARFLGPRQPTAVGA